MAALVALLRPMASEFVVVDTGSSYEAKAIMRGWTLAPEPVPLTLIEETFEDFSTTRNKGLALHKHEWTLGIDPDELPSLAMLNHIQHVTSPVGMDEFAAAKGWTYFTYNWWGGVLGPSMDYHWHTRLWKTEGSYLYRPVHELVMVQGESELILRNQPALPQAPRSAYLIHSKGSEDIRKADEMYASMGEVSR